MSKQAALRVREDAVAEEATSIVKIVEATPEIVLIDAAKAEELFAAMKAEITAHVPDLTSKKGRDATKALAFKVTRTKTAIDAAGKKLNEAARKQIGVVDAARRGIWERLETLADQVRKPVTDWETAEDERETRCRAVADQIKAARNITITDTAEIVMARSSEIAAIVVIEAEFRDEYSDMVNYQAETVSLLEAAADRLTREEADRAELERLRAAQAERERLDAEDAQRKVDEERRLAAEKAEAERVAAAEKRAQEEAEGAAARKTEAEKAELQRQHDAALQAERDRAASELKAEQDRAAEADRLRREAEAKAKQERAEAAATAERQAEADRQRAADQAHRSRVLIAARAAIMEAASIDVDSAQDIVLAIAAGSIPAVSIAF